MKSIFTFLFLAFFTLSVSQDLSLDVEELVLELDGHIEYGDVLLTNTGTDSLEIAVRLERECYMDGDVTQIQVCIGVLCFFPVEHTTTWGDSGGDPILVLAPNEPSDALKFQPGPIGDLGSRWNVVFYDRNNPDNNATLVVSITEECTPASTRDFAYEVGEAFPNPAENFITIPYVFDTNEAQLLVFNTIGVQLETVNLDRLNRQVEIDVENYLDGIYFYYISDGKGGQSQMRSFVK